MGRLDFRAIEGVLYSLGRAPDARPASATLAPGRPMPGPRGPFRESVRRLDVTIASRQLSEADRDVLLQHYVLGHEQPGFARRRAIRMLRMVLDSAEAEGDDNG